MDLVTWITVIAGIVGIVEGIVTIVDYLQRRAKNPLRIGIAVGALLVVLVVVLVRLGVPGSQTTPTPILFPTVTLVPPTATPAPLTVTPIRFRCVLEYLEHRWPGLTVGLFVALIGAIIACLIGIVSISDQRRTPARLLLAGVTVVAVLLFIGVFVHILLPPPSEKECPPTPTPSATATPTPTPVLPTATPTATSTPTPAPMPTATRAPCTSGRISFVSQRSGRDEIYVMDANGANLARLATGIDPAWSSDGRRMAFGSAPGEISVINADGTGLQVLTNRRDWQPTWSPDGRRIAFMSERDGNRQIYVMDANGQNQARLTNHSFDDRHPSWSPDGEKIAFISNRPREDGSQKWQIWVMDPNGTNQTILTKEGVDHYRPVWSPDSRKIAFGVWTGQRNEIWVMDANGANATMLTADFVYILEGQGYGLSWSPSYCIAFVSNKYGNPDIYAMWMDGTGLVRITADPAKAFSPIWLK